MESNKLTFSQYIDSDMLDRFPVFKDQITDDLSRKIGENILLEISKGEKIFSISEPIIRDDYRTCLTEMRLILNITDLIRCKDCKYYQKDTDVGSFCNREKFMYANMEVDDYCSYAERGE